MGYPLLISFSEWILVKTLSISIISLCLYLFDQVFAVLLCILYVDVTHTEQCILPFYEWSCWDIFIKTYKKPLNMLQVTEWYCKVSTFVLPLCSKILSVTNWANFKMLLKDVRTPEGGACDIIIQNCTQSLGLKIKLYSQSLVILIARMNATGPVVKCTHAKKSMVYGRSIVVLAAQCLGIVMSGRSNVYLIQESCLTWKVPLPAEVV